MELLPLVCLCLLSCSGDAVRVLVKEDSDAVLPCSISTEDLVGKLFDWRKDDQKEVFIYDAGNHYNNGRTGQDEQFKGRVSHFQDQLQNGNASIKITRTKMADSGIYSCDFPRHQPSQTFYIELVVDAAPEPYIRTLDDKPDRVLLQCEAHGVLPPTVEWKDSDDNILPAEEPQITKRGKYSYVSVKITVTKTGDYRCVATQEEISHLIAAVIPVHIQGAASEPSVTIIETDEGTMLQCKVLGASPKPKVEWKDSSGNILPVKDLKETENGGLYDIVLQAAVTKTDNFRCVVTQEGSDSPLSAKIHAAVTGSNTGMVIVGVVCSLLLGVGIGCCLAVLYMKHRNKQNRKKGSTPVAANGQPDANEGTTMIESE